MKTIEITEANFEATIAKGIVLIDFWAEWCAPCRMFAPIFEAAAARHPDVVFGKVNTEVQRGLAAAFEVRAIPTLMIIRDGVVLGAQPGALPGKVLDEVIRQVRALDMDEVRAKAVAEPEVAATAP